MAWILVTVKQCNGSTSSTAYEAAPKENHRSWSFEEEPALYFLAEVSALKDRTPDELKEVHKAKVAFPGVRLVQG